MGRYTRYTDPEPKVPVVGGGERGELLYLVFPFFSSFSAVAYLGNDWGGVDGWWVRKERGRGIGECAIGDRVDKIEKKFSNLWI